MKTVNIKLQDIPRQKIFNKKYSIAMKEAREDEKRKETRKII